MNNGSGKPKVGQTVKVTNVDSSFRGKVGEVVHRVADSGTLNVKFGKLVLSFGSSEVAVV